MTLEKKIGELMLEREKLEQTIAYLESQRGTLGDAVVEASIAALREKLGELARTTGANEVGSPLANIGAQEHSGRRSGERKQISILFADISGFTRLSEKLDAEDVTMLINQVWERLDRVILHHGGTIDKHTGDGLMALWGAGQAQENDAEQAIRAALAMQAEMKSWADSQQPGLSIRIGIHTGIAMLGEVGRGQEFTALGDAVNVCSRLERAAPPGGTLISADTYRHVRGVFDVLNLDPISVRGRSQAVQVYLVRREKPRAFRKGMRGIEGVETSMVGRQQEMETLKKLFRSLFEPEAGQVVRSQTATIWGEAGVGKSRLLHEFDVWAEMQQHSFYYFKGRADPAMQTQPFALLRDLFSYRFQIQDSDSPATVSEKITNGLALALANVQPSTETASVHAPPEVDLTGRAHFIGQLLGYDFQFSPLLAHTNTADDAQQARERGLRYILEYFLWLCVDAPVLLLLEDLHWADDSSLEALESLQRGWQEGRLLLVQTCRPQILERRPKWKAGGKELRLQPLPMAESRQLVSELLQKMAQVPEALCELVVSKAEGNPFYIEEMLKMLIEDGVIRTDEEPWQVDAGRLALARVPATLTAVLQARFDRLPVNERAALQRAAVVGRTFWGGAVAFLLQAENETVNSLPGDEASQATEAALQALQGREMIFQRDDSSFLGVKEYTFKHNLLREMVYESILKRQRLAYHLRAADWLRRNSSEQDADITGMIAHHLTQAGRSSEAGQYLLRAAELSLKVGAHQEAIRFCERALDNLAGEESNGSGRVRALLLAGQAQTLAGNYHQARLRLEQCLVLARKLNDQRNFAAAFIQLGRLTLTEGQIVEARHQLAEGLSLARATGDQAIVAQALLEVSFVEIKLGELEAARQCLEECLGLYRLLGDRRGEAFCLLRSGAEALVAEEYARAEMRLEESLELFRKLGDQLGIQAALNNLGALARRVGDLEQAESYLAQAVRIGRNLGHYSGLATALGNLGATQLQLKQTKAARAQALEGLQIALQAGAISIALQNLVVYSGALALPSSEAGASSSAARIELALSALGMALEHPGLSSDETAFANWVVESLRAEFGAEAVEAGLRNGRQRPFETVVGAILRQAASV